MNIGDSVGVYRVVSALGAGGMGEVYRAHDTTLNRDVAIKTLPDAVAHDQERIARFTREAQMLAALNHPHIAQLYGVIEEGGADHVHALVMELVEGEDLAVLIARGPVPVADALPIARQIAEALEAAHEQGVIHRDLKPANIKVRPDGTVKVLDFGLAKALDPAAASGVNAMNSPTLTAGATQAGLIVGTAAYMAPEQARGKAVDKRADIWAFGVVLYEMLTGQRMFKGEDVSETLASVLKDAPDFAGLPAAVPPRLRRVLERCLERDPKLRLRDIGEARVEIAKIENGAPDTSSVAIPAVGTSSHRRSPWLWVAASLVVAAAAGAAAWWLKPVPPVIRPIVRFALQLDDGQQLANTALPLLAWSADGRRLAYRAAGVIFVRSLDELKPREAARALGSGLCFSPDGESIVYGTADGLFRVAATGGTPQAIAAIKRFGGFDCAGDGSVVYSDTSRIVRVGAAGGGSTVLVTASAGGLVLYPHVLPGGRTLLYTAIESLQPAVFVRPLDGSGDPRAVLKGVGAARYVPTGHLVYTGDGRLQAVPFDAGTLQITGEAVAMPESVYFSASTQHAQLDVSSTGTLAYLAGDEMQALQLAWVGPPGRAAPAMTVPHNYSDPALSPDGHRVALHLFEQDSDVWVADLVRGSLARITFSKEEEETPVWSPDGRELAYAANRDGTRMLIRKPADGSAAAVERRIWQASDHFHVNGWSPDGRTILVESRRTQTRNDIIAVDVEKGTARDLLASPYSEYNSRFSPDGKWLAYVSDESGRPEVYVQPYPALNARVAVSTTGGVEPVWSRDGRQLYFRTADSFMAAAVTKTAPLEFGPPRELFRDTFTRTQGVAHTHYDVTADGQFLVIQNPASQGSKGRIEFQIVLNWTEELKRLAPRK